ncbi:MAG: TonB-dependent receptor, partial [Gammaproteobacteria bacterium]|nr:TonB-dependent receptor [Gammaproteobacteria bacterium]
LNGATAAFDEAIRLEPWAPLPRLGRGLALIRGGDLTAGRSELETAVILDPNNSLVRSYMGKAYYEEKRDKLAASQLAIAKELDPNDPTPWFYDAIRKQTLNDPVAALRDLDQAIRHNENRNVYRSRLQLDQDLAARSASQGRIYQDLGFGELALRAGARSVQVAPTDFSGHRLLADSYSVLPRHEIARVNELFQSQMLQPLNVNPVQPQLGEANISVVDSGGPGGVAFNEFNPLFNRDRLAAQGSAVVGNKNTLGADGVLAGIEGRMSFSLGAYTYESDGFRTNNDVDERTYNALVQFQQSPSTSWLAEVRDAEREFGELKLLYLDRIDAGLPRQEENSTNFRAGVRHDLAPNSTVAAFVNYATGDTGLSSTEPFIIGDTDFDTWTVEAQYLYTAERWRLVTGARVFTGDFDDTNTALIELPDPPFLIEQTVTDQFSTRSLSAYAYVTGDVIPDKLWVTVGASADHLNGQEFDDQRVNPKVGITWMPSERTEVRLGAITTLQRPSVTRQEFVPSLEPTTISGFNQFYFGSEGEKNERYGIGIDHRLTESLAVGAEYSEAELKVPFLEFVFIPPDIFDFVGRSATVDEKLGRAWLYWSPGERGSLRALYDYYDVDTPVLTALRYNRLETHAFALAASYFSPTGFSAGIVPKYVHQRGRFQDISIPFAPFEPDSDSFVVVDAYASLRLPLRAGILRLEVNNLFDREFTFQDVDPERSRVAPERFVLMRVTVAY